MITDDELRLKYVPRDDCDFDTHTHTHYRKSMATADVVVTSYRVHVDNGAQTIPPSLVSRKRFAF